MTLDDLLEAWVAWDQWPAARSAVKAKEDAIAALGLDGSVLHRRVAELRLREGAQVEAAVRQAAAEQGIRE